MAVILRLLLFRIARILWFECLRVKKWVSATNSSSEKLNRQQNMTVLSENAKKLDNRRSLDNIHQSNTAVDVPGWRFEERAAGTFCFFFPLFSLWWWTTEAFIVHYFSLYLYCSFVFVSLSLKSHSVGNEISF